MPEEVPSASHLKAKLGKVCRPTSSWKICIVLPVWSWTTRYMCSAVRLGMIVRVLLEKFRWIRKLWNLKSDSFSRRILSMNSEDYSWSRFYLQLRQARVGHRYSHWSNFKPSFSSIKLDEITVAHVYGSAGDSIEIWKFEEFARSEFSQVRESDWGFYPGLFLLD